MIEFVLATYSAFADAVIPQLLSKVPTEAKAQLNEFHERYRKLVARVHELEDEIRQIRGSADYLAQFEEDPATGAFYRTVDGVRHGPFCGPCTTRTRTAVLIGPVPSQMNNFFPGLGVCGSCSARFPGIFLKR